MEFGKEMFSNRRTTNASRRRLPGSPSSNYQCWLIILLLGFFSLILTGLFLAFTLQPINVDPDRVFVAPAPVQTYTTYAVVATTTRTPTTTTTAAPTTTPAPVTPVPIPPIAVVCPNDASVPLGKPYDISVTGNALGSGGCDSGGPIVTHSDVLVGTLARYTERRHIVDSRHTSHESASLVIRGQEGIESCSPTVIMPGIDSHNCHIAGERKKKEQSLFQRLSNMLYPSSSSSSSVRSPTFSATNVYKVSQFDYSDGGSGDASNVVTQSNGEYVLTAFEAALGSYVTVADTNMTELGMFYMSSIATGNCSVSGAGAFPQVEWDTQRSRWVLSQSIGSLLCLFTSDTTSPLGSWTQHEYSFTTPIDYPKLGMWNQIYLLTLRQATNNMCVINAANLTQMFCASSFSGPLPGFPAASQTWTPVTQAPLSILPIDTETASTNTNGAVFMRLFDEELSGSTFSIKSSIFDYIDIEHWNGIHFENATFIRLRYRAQVADFDMSYAGCTSIDECIPTPTSQGLTPVRQTLMHRLSFRYACNKGSIVGAFTSHANGVDRARVKWFELRWEKPTATTAEMFVTHQDGSILMGGNLHTFLPTIAMDGNGTIAIGYAASSSTVNPSLYVTSHVANDPLGQARTPLLLAGGEAGSVLGSNLWGESFSITSSLWREFYFAGQRSAVSVPWLGSTTKIRVSGETIMRIFVAQDTCGGFISCGQNIRME